MNVDSDREHTPATHFRHLGWFLRFLIPTWRRGAREKQQASYPWTRVLWLTGVDYFSTLGYQPGIAFLAAGALSPVATLILVAVTLLGALPVYIQVAKRSFAGLGSIAMLEQLIPKWKGKLCVLAVLGFAATAFVITMTLSAADAAQHAVENPLLHDILGEHRMLVTCVLLFGLAAVFIVGFKGAIGIAMFVAVPYIALNAIVIARGFYELMIHPDLIARWLDEPALQGDWTSVFLASALVFPRLALGLSGFETGVTVIPLVRGELTDSLPPAGRIRNTGKLLTTAAAIMSVMLIGTSLVSTTLIPPGEFQPGGQASGRAIAYLAHDLLGGVFGSLYDLSTIAILSFAGASAMTGLLNLIPRYLPRFGMAPRWAEFSRPLVLILLGINLMVTWAFDADVDAQVGAYATGVLVLILSAAVAVSLTLWRDARAETGVAVWRLRGQSLYFWVVTAVLTYAVVANVYTRPDGLIIAFLFILAILLVSAISRFWRATEIRVVDFSFFNPASQRAWKTMQGKVVNLVPVASTDDASLRVKAARLRSYYRAEGPIAFVHIELADDRSEFKSHIRIQVRKIKEIYIINIYGAAAIANNLAWVSEQLDPIAIYLELTLQNSFIQAFKYLLWGEGEVGVLVYEILVRHWRSTPEEDIRPLIFLVSR